jgi:nucleoside 2-deoxyribosyltransferase
MLEEDGHEVWLPQERGGLRVSDVKCVEIFRSDIEGLDWCDTIVAVLDGSDPQSGIGFELGYGYAKNKSLFGLRTDFRTTLDNMLESSTIIYRSIQELREALKRSDVHTAV